MCKLMCRQTDDQMCRQTDVNADRCISCRTGRQNRIDLQMNKLADKSAEWTTEWTTK